MLHKGASRQPASGAGHSHDGRFLINQPVETSTTPPITLILNWKPKPSSITEVNTLVTWEKRFLEFIARPQDSSDARVVGIPDF